MRTLLTALAFAANLAAQNWDTSGNGLLKGRYNFRQVVWNVRDVTGNLARAVAITGSLDFDGSGRYRLDANVADSNQSGNQRLAIEGDYAISASGHGFLTNPARESGRVYGSVANGIFIGSSTEEPLTDLFVAVSAGPSAPTNASLNGRYWIAELNFPSLNIAQVRDALYQINADGQGNLGTINATGFIGNGAAVNQTVTGARYSFSGETATVTFGGTLTNTNLLAGTRSLFVSPNGDFVAGGSSNGWDMLVGVRAIDGAAPSTLMDGLFILAGVDVNTRNLDTQRARVNSYYGAFRAGNGTFIGHQRLLTQFTQDASAYDYTYSDSYELKQDGTYDDYLGLRNITGAGGAIRIGFGLRNAPGISVAVRVPNFTGDGVYINPASVVNAASFAPFTQGIAPGELIQLSGNNLAAAEASDDTFPNTLGGVQVRVNERLAPIKSVGPEKITLLVPYATGERIARIQVLRDGVESNVVTAFSNVTAPGIFTVPPGGTGWADALHADSSPVTKDSPARLGETITLRVTGLGQVTPEVPDGAPGPSDPQSRAVADIAVWVDGTRASVSFSGLAPGVAGVYHITFAVPSSLTPGDLFVDVSGPDAYSTQAQIPVVRAAGDVEPMRLRGTPERSAGRGGRPDWQPRGSRRVLR